MRERLVSVGLLLAIWAGLMIGALVWMEARVPPPFDGGVPAMAAPPALGATQRFVFSATSITQTFQYGSVDVLDTTIRHVYYRVVPSTTGTLTITVNGMWQNVIHSTQTVTAALVGTTAKTGVITATTTPLYPVLRVGAQVSAGTGTATLAVVAQ